ncbi:hypothetical protein Droror1_Dr00012897 [Drosera rotundifolia]
MPPGRKASKEKARAKRQKSEDAQSSIDDRIVKSIDDMNASSAVEIAKISAQNAEDKQMGIRLKRIQMNKERIQSIKSKRCKEEICSLTCENRTTNCSGPSVLGI